MPAVIRVEHMSKAKENFLKQCRAKDAETNEEAIERGRLKWFVGKPAYADESYAAIALSDSVTVTFREADIGATDEERDGLFRIGLKPDASILVSENRVVKLESCDCGTDTGNPGTVWTPLRYDLNKVAGFEIDRQPDLTVPGLPTPVDPCIKARNNAFDNCMKWPGSYTTMCGAVSAAAETGCRSLYQYGF